MTARRVKRLFVPVLAVLALVGLVSATPANAALSGNVEISGHGYGHGRGMSQWGARGYAVDYGWTAAQILDHYYGGTTAGHVANPTLAVELMSLGGQPVAITSPALTVNGTAVGTPFVLVKRNANGTVNAYKGTGCNGPWTSWLGSLASPVTVASTASPSNPLNFVQVCQGSLLRGYRGVLTMVDTGSTSAVVNRLPVEDYLRGVVPREMPASWGDLGSGRGAQALQTQAVAARSYSLAGLRNSYASTCDSTTCQVYSGAFTRPVGNTSWSSLEDARTNAAIAASAGVVRVDSGGHVSRTEFSSSSGGWTTGGTFPAVQDLGDATAANPHHDWSLSVDAGALAADLSTPAITGISVTQRNGLGADGGRVLQVVVDTTGGQYTFTGNQFRSRVGLQSDWFMFNLRSYAQSVSFTKALYADLLGRSGSSSEVAGWAGAVADGSSPGGVARTILTSTEGLQGLVTRVYSAALHRAPSANDYRTWVAYLRSGATYNDLNGGVFGAQESLRALGGGDVRLWVNGVYQALLGRGAGATERSNWASVAAARGLKYVVLNISTSAEARQRRLNGYYTALLHRSVDASGVQTWMPLMARIGDVDVQVFITGSAEYWNRAVARFP
jgi:SpoIID/LytB domain protein